MRATPDASTTGIHPGDITASVHDLTFETTPALVAASEGCTCPGIEHPKYAYDSELPEATALKRSIAVCGA